MIKLKRNEVMCGYSYFSKGRGRAFIAFTRFPINVG